MRLAFARPLALLALVIACGDDGSRATADLVTTTADSSSTTGDTDPAPTGSTTTAPTTSITATTDLTATTDPGVPLDPCGGCDGVCDPVDGCLACDLPGVCPDAVLYAAPDGTGRACTYGDPCSLLDAQAWVRTLNAVMTAELRVYLRGGTYRLGAPWVLDAADSGKGGHDVVWRAYPGETPIISGGVELGPWTLVDPAKNIHRTPVPSVSRQLYVGDRRAVRARGPDVAPGFVETAGGWTAPDAAVASWQNIGDVEVVGHRYWKSFRCPLAGAAGLDITVQDPCWTDAQLHKDMDVDFTLDLPRWFENARELLDEPGEFYLDRAAMVLDHIPRAGVDLAAGGAVLPVLETLLHGAGTLAAPLRHVRFEGLTFAHATWLAPSGPQGYVEMQAGIRLVGGGTWASQKTPAAVRFEAADHVTISGCTFTHLGAGGLSFELGAHDNLVVGNRFDDLSAGAIQLGDVTEPWHHHPEDPATIVRDNTVRDNFVTRTGVEYPSTVAIWAGYTEGTRIEHNDLFDLPYTGISVGWGWGAVDTDPIPASSADNHVEGNRVGYHMRVLEDGGGIYTLGAQLGSTTAGNYVHNQGGPYGALYLDNGTQHYAVTGNVVEKVDYWLLCTTYATDATNNVVTDNYSELDNPFVQPDPPHASNTIADNVVFGQTMPPEALAIVAAAGLGPEHRALHPDDLARGLPATASSIYDPTHPASQGNDGDGRTGWSPLGGAEDPNPWWQVDLQAAQPLSGAEVVTRWELDQPSTRADLEIVGANQPDASDGVVLARLGPDPLPHRAIWSARWSDRTPYRYLRVRKAGYMYLGEVRVLAAP